MISGTSSVLLFMQIEANHCQSPLETDTFTTATLTHFLLGDLPMLQCQKLFRPNYVIIMIGSTVQVLHWYKTHVDFNF